MSTRARPRSRGPAPYPWTHMPSEQDVLAVLATVAGPDGRTPLSLSGSLGGVVVREDRVFVSLEIDPADPAAAEPLRAKVEAAVKSMAGVAAAFVTLTAQKPPGSGRPAGPPPTRTPTGPHTHPHPGPGPKAQAARTPQGVKGVKTIVAVASGKGGVGKSTTAANVGAGVAGPGPACRHPRRRHLRPLDAAVIRAEAEARGHRGPSDAAARGVRHQDHVDRFSWSRKTRP